MFSRLFVFYFKCKPKLECHISVFLVNTVVMTNCYSNSPLRLINPAQVNAERNLLFSMCNNGEKSFLQPLEGSSESGWTKQTGFLGRSCLQWVPFLWDGLHKTQAEILMSTACEPSQWTSLIKGVFYWLL